MNEKPIKQIPYGAVYEVMKKISILAIITVFTISLIPGTAVGQEKKDKKNKDESYNYKKDKFYNETRFIMSKDEVEIYKHLADNEARESFIEDFWGKRDPTPGTEENENRIEYERRVKYVERFFKEKIGSGRGWESDRGKVYLLLGEPDEKSTQAGTLIDRFGQVKQVLMETWTYNYHRLYLRFADADGFGIYRLDTWSPSLLSAFERAKFAIIPTGKAAQTFKFKSSVENNEVKVLIPIKTVSFAEKENTMKARFKVTLFIYHRYKKIDRLEQIQDFSGPKEELLNRENIRLTIPVTLTSKGKYLLEVIVEEVGSGARYRETIKVKL
jgi:GWxTD domain-containing protein